MKRRIILGDRVILGSGSKIIRTLRLRFGEVYFRGVQMQAANQACNFPNLVKQSFCRRYPDLLTHRVLLALIEGDGDSLLSHVGFQGQ